MYHRVLLKVSYKLAAYWYTSQYNTLAIVFRPFGIPATRNLLIIWLSNLIIEEEFEDTKGVIRIRKSKIPKG